jgi:hypothetical protein
VADTDCRILLRWDAFRAHLVDCASNDMFQRRSHSELGTAELKVYYSAGLRPAFLYFVHFRMCLATDLVRVPRPATQFRLPHGVASGLSSPASRCDTLIEIDGSRFLRETRSVIIALRPMRPMRLMLDGTMQ